MKNSIGILLIAIAAYCTLTSSNCNKNNNISGGGKGGNATLTAIPEAHGVYLDSCTVYIKYGTLDAPASGIYDDSITTIVMESDTIPTVTFHNLKTGLYYVFGLGYHKANAEHFVAGGVPVTIQKEDSMSIYLPTYSCPIQAPYCR